MDETATATLLAADNRSVHVDDYEEHSMEGVSLLLCRNAGKQHIGSNKPTWRNQDDILDLICC